DLIENKLYRAIYSNRQLEEVLADFWMNHFNVFNGKGQDRVLLTSFERDAIRPHVFGHFKDMLLATARHPAMLFYLDNWQSQAPREDVPAPPGVRRPGLNENYGRELMELDTLGVDGGYTQDDVIAVARALLHTLFTSPEFVSEGAWEAKLKSPLEMVVSAARAMNAEVTDTFALAQRIADLGEPLYGKLEPTGYPNTGDAWLNTAGVMERINFASAFAAGQIPGVRVDVSRFRVKDPRALAREVLNVAPSAS